LVCRGPEWALAAAPRHPKLGEPGAQVGVVRQPPLQPLPLDRIELAKRVGDKLALDAIVWLT
jgi:hypothetical protein